MAYTANFAEISGSQFHGVSHKVLRLEEFPGTGDNSLCFLTKLQPGTELPRAVGHCTVFAPTELVEPLVSAGYSVIEVANPKFELARAWAELSDDSGAPGIHPTAVIGERVSIGANVQIGPYCILEGDVEIGDNCRIGARCSLVNRVALGMGVRLRNGNVLGEDAFSYGFKPRAEAGPEEPNNVRFPSTGGIQVGDFVEIGNNCAISRGIFDDTRIANCVRINDLVHIGNTVEIGFGSMVMAQTDISARVRIGTDCWIGQSAAVRQGVAIGDGAQVGMGAVVVSDVPAGMVAMGVPAKTTGKRKGL